MSMIRSIFLAMAFIVPATSTVALAADEAKPAEGEKAEKKAKKSKKAEGEKKEEAAK